jgi:hypothetical protein
MDYKKVDRIADRIKNPTKTPFEKAMSKIKAERRDAMKTPMKKLSDKEKAERLMANKMKSGGLKGGQKKLDKNNNNRIDAQDFKILKAEKAKGRGMGLQDESIKPGKVQKAFVGKMIKGAGKSIGRLFGKKKSATATPGAMVSQKASLPINLVEEYKKAKGLKVGGESKSDKVKRAFPEKSPSGRAKIETMLGSKYTPMKRERLFAGSAARRKEGFKKLLKNVRKAIPGVGMLDVKVTKNSKGGGADMSKNKKSKSGSSVKDIFKSYGKYDGKPIELSKGGGADTGTRGEIRSKLSVAADRFKRRMSQMPGKITDEERKKIKELLKDVKPARPARPMPNIKSDGPKRLMPSRPKPSLGPMARRMGGGMINKPMGYKKGASIMARGCKLGRKKTTKLY